mmetsp:Transcript_4239/g.7433  ORF Transcript_4239/g.7433 Transcript_4239/m.7433 type:complete len:110 (+) Transcript_4239:223-552(+)
MGRNDQEEEESGENEEFMLSSRWNLKWCLDQVWSWNNYRMILYQRIEHVCIHYEQLFLYFFNISCLCYNWIERFRNSSQKQLNSDACPDLFRSLRWSIVYKVKSHDSIT